METDLTAAGAEQQQEMIVFIEDPIDENIMKSVLTIMGLPLTAVMKGSIKDATQYLKIHRSPKILIVDLSSSQLPVSDMNDLAEVCEPVTGVIALGTRNDVGLFRELKSLGVNDYLVKPLSIELVQRAIAVFREDPDQAQNANVRLGKLVSIIGMRGGVGSTLIATNLAYIFSQEKAKRVALVDWDFHFGNVAMMLDMKPSLGFKEALETPQRIDALFMDRILMKYSDRLSVLCGEEDLSNKTIINEESFNAMAPIMRNQFHYIIADIKRFINSFTIQFLQNSSLIVLICDLSLVSIREVNRFLTLLNNQASKKRILVVANRVGAHHAGEISPEEFEKAINRPINHLLMVEPQNVLNSINLGKLLAQTNSPLVAGLRRIAEDIMGNLQAEQNTGILSYIKKWFTKAP